MAPDPALTPQPPYNGLKDGRFDRLDNDGENKLSAIAGHFHATFAMLGNKVGPIADGLTRVDDRFAFCLLNVGQNGALKVGV